MNALVNQAAEHWSYVAPLLRPPVTEDDYNRLVGQLDEIVALIGGQPDHPLAGLASAVGALIEGYDDEHRPMPAATGADALRYLLQAHGLGRKELPEIGSEAVVSGILSGRRRITVRHAKALSARFDLPAVVFLSL